MVPPPVPPGAEAQVDYGYLGLWPDPSTGRATVGVLDGAATRGTLFVRPAVSMTQRA
jgi:hypothetical protein